MGKKGAVGENGFQQTAAGWVLHEPTGETGKVLIFDLGACLSPGLEATATALPVADFG